MPSPKPSTASKRSTAKSTPAPTPDAPSALAFAIAHAEGDQATQVQALVDDILRWARRMMEFGSDSDRNAFVKAALPALTRALAEKQEQQQIVQMRAAYEEMQLMLKVVPLAPARDRFAAIKAALATATEAVDASA